MLIWCSITVRSSFVNWIEPSRIFQWGWLHCSVCRNVNKKHWLFKYCYIYSKHIQQWWNKIKMKNASWTDSWPGNVDIDLRTPSLGLESKGIVVYSWNKNLCMFAYHVKNKISSKLNRLGREIRRSKKKSLAACAYGLDNQNHLRFVLGVNKSWS